MHLPGFRRELRRCSTSTTSTSTLAHSYVPSSPTSSDASTTSFNALTSRISHWALIAFISYFISHYYSSFVLAQVFIGALIIDGVRSRQYPSGDRLLVLRTAALAEGISVVKSWTEVGESRWLWVTVIGVVVFVEWARWREESEGGDGEGKGEVGDLGNYCCCS